MAGTSYPFEGDSLSPTEWGQMARLWQRNGVVAGLSSQLEVSISGPDAIIGTGALWLHGHIYHNPSTESVTLAGGDNYICAVVSSTPAGISFITQSSAPALSDRRKVALAYYNGSALTDLRTWAGETVMSLFLGTGNTVISTGTSLIGVPMPYDVMIMRWQVVANSSGALSVGILRTTYDGWSATAGNNILTVSIGSGQIKGQSSSNDLNITVRRGRYLRTNVASVSTIKQACISLYLAPLYVSV